jgi:hypothetical protein
MQSSLKNLGFGRGDFQDDDVMTELNAVSVPVEISALEDIGGIELSFASDQTIEHECCGSKRYLLPRPLPKQCLLLFSNADLSLRRPKETMDDFLIEMGLAKY